MRAAANLIFFWKGIWKGILDEISQCRVAAMTHVNQPPALPMAGRVALVGVGDHDRNRHRLYLLTFGARWPYCHGLALGTAGRRLSTAGDTIHLALARYYAHDTHGPLRSRMPTYRPSHHDHCAARGAQTHALRKPRHDEYLAELNGGGPKTNLSSPAEDLLHRGHSCRGVGGSERVAMPAIGPATSDSAALRTCGWTAPVLRKDDTHKSNDSSRKGRAMAGAVAT